MQTEDVIAFLRDNPEFLLQQAHALGLKPAHAHERGVFSLSERLMLDLKDHNRQLENRLQQLIQHGETNDQTVERMHALALALLRARSAAATVEAAVLCFEQTFGLTHAALRLWHPAAALRAPAFSTDNEIVRAQAEKLARPYCGPYVNDTIMGWFPPTPVLQSFAQVPLSAPGNTQPFGLLVLASDDAHRFTLDMQTHYLSLMGELVSTALLGWLETA